MSKDKYEIYIDQDDLTSLSNISMDCVKYIKPGVLDYTQLQNAMIILALQKTFDKLGMGKVVMLDKELLLVDSEKI